MKNAKELYKIGKDYIVDNAPTILTGLGVVGVVSTSVLSAKATPKAIKLLEEKEEYKRLNYGEELTRFEKFLAVAPAYIPTVLSGTATCACILGANKINQNRQASLLSSYASLHSIYEGYKTKVKEIYGEDGAKYVEDEIEKEKKLTDEFGGSNEPCLFYDEYSHRYFEMSIFDMMRAIYQANRMYNFDGEMSLNNFYEFLNLAPVDFGDQLGWNAIKDSECRGYAWLDITWTKIETPDNLEAFGLMFTVAPSEDWLDWSEFQQY